MVYCRLIEYYYALVGGAVVYSRKGNYPKALEWHQKALVIREKVLGKEHPSTALTYNNLALVNSHLSDYPKALEWYQLSYDIISRVLGENHPCTKAVKDNIDILISNAPLVTPNP